MTNKIDEISNLISLNSYDIVITESWLNSDVTDNYVSQSGYKTFRRDRSNDQRGGRICTYIRKQLHIVEICDMYGGQGLPLLFFVLFRLFIILYNLFIYFYQNKNKLK